MKNLQTSRARIVLSSSPTRRRGSILNLAPSSSPTPISPPDGGSIGGGALDTRAAMLAHAENGREDVAARALGAATVRRRTDRRTAILMFFF